MISQPISRAIDKALRMLSLTYEIQAARWGLSAVSLYRLLPWYQRLEENPRALERMFEHDKADLRRLEVPIVTQLIGDPPEPRYRVDVARLQLPAVAPHHVHWAALKADAARFQALADLLPTLPGREAAPLSFVLLALRTELDLRIPAWTIPRHLLTNARCVLEWSHAILHAVEALGRPHQTFGGALVPVRQIAELTGFPEQFVWHLAFRGANRPEGHSAEPHVVRIVATAPEEGIAVAARDLRRGWRPRRLHVDALIAWAERRAEPLPPDVIQALRTMQRGWGGAPAVPGGGSVEAG